MSPAYEYADTHTHTSTQDHAIAAFSDAKIFTHKNKVENKSNMVSWLQAKHAFQGDLFAGQVSFQVGEVFEVEEDKPARINQNGWTFG